MNTDIKMQQELPNDLKEKLKLLKDNMLIAAAKRNGGRLEFTLAEIDAATDMIVLSVENGKFIIQITERKLS